MTPALAEGRKGDLYRLSGFKCYAPFRQDQVVFFSATLQKISTFSLDCTLAFSAHSLAFKARKNRIRAILRAVLSVFSCPYLQISANQAFADFLSSEGSPCRLRYPFAMLRAFLLVNFADSMNCRNATKIASG